MATRNTLLHNRNDSIVASLYGTIDPFNEAEDTWAQYVKSLEQYFIANDVEDDRKQRAIFLSVCGPKAYSLIRDLLQPRKPSATDIKEILEIKAFYAQTKRDFRTV